MDVTIRLQRRRRVAGSAIWYYAFAEEGTLPVDNYRATIRVTPIVDGDRAFVEWWATFDCEPGKREERTVVFSAAFAGWLESLRRTLVKAGV